MTRVWRGRCRDRTWKAFVSLGDQLVSTIEAGKAERPRIQLTNRLRWSYQRGPLQSVVRTEAPRR
jgi:hypothetical protein